MAPTDPPAVAKALVHAIQAHSASHRGHTGCTNSNSLRCFVMVAGLPHVSVTMWAPSGSDWQSEYLRMDMSTETGFSAAQRDNGSRGGMTRGMSSASSAAASDESAAVAERRADAAVMGAGFVLPTLAELPSFMPQLVQRHGAAAVVAELLKVVPASQLRAACDAAWGVQHDEPEERARRMAIGEVAPVVTPLTGQARTVGILQQRSPIGAAVLFGTDGIIHRQCWHCEPEFGRHDAQCSAVALLESDELKAELAALKDGLDAREAEEGISAEARKAARYCMYRKYVGEQWGVIGRGKRPISACTSWPSQYSCLSFLSLTISPASRWQLTGSIVGGRRAQIGDRRCMHALIISLHIVSGRFK